MKNLSQIEAKITEVVEQIETLTNTLQEGAEPSVEVQMQFAVFVTTLATIAWVTDSEDEFKPVLDKIRLASAAGELERKLTKPTRTKK